MKVEDIARVCHEANRELQRILGEPMNPPWDETPENIQASAIDGVKNAQGGATPEESHENWLRFKRDDGWTYGAEKDFDKKTHPCFVPYHQLPDEQKQKDELFISIVRALS